MKKLLLLTLISGAYLNAQTEIHPTTGPIQTTNTAPVGGEMGFLEKLASIFNLTQGNQALTQTEIGGKINTALQGVNTLLQTKSAHLPIDENQISGIINTLSGYAKGLTTGIRLSPVQQEIVTLLKPIYLAIFKADQVTASAARPGEQIRTASNTDKFINALKTLFANHNAQAASKDTNLISLDKPLLEDVKIENGTFTIQDLYNLSR